MFNSLLSGVVGPGLAWCKTRGAISTLLCELVHERLLWTSEDFVWPVDSTIHAEEASSIWPNDIMLRSSASESILRCLSRMLHESIDADVTINTGEEDSKAHKAILSVSSRVFHSRGEQKNRY
ncbi:BTB/POZ domain-containing protein [Tanacetum coccineum]